MGAWRRRHATAVVVCVFALVASGCGGGVASPPSQAQPTALTEAEKVYEKFNKLRGAEREAALVAAAKAEGTVSVYGSINIHTAVGDLFTKKYGIKFDFYGANAETMDARMQAEQAAGHYVTDILATNATYLAADSVLGYFAHYESDYRDKIPKEAQGNNWTASRYQTSVVGWNTDLVKPADLPSDYGGFADPKWKGKLAAVEADDYWYFGIINYLISTGKTEQQATDIMLGIAKNTRMIVGHSNLYDALSAGQIAVALCAHDDGIEELKRDGGPASWGGEGYPRLKPVILSPNGAAVFKHAPHPAAAMLYMDFLFSPEAQQVYRSQLSHPSLGASALDALPQEIIWRIDADAFATQKKKWADAYDVFKRQTGGA